MKGDQCPKVEWSIEQSSFGGSTLGQEVDNIVAGKYFEAYRHANGL